MQHRHPDGPGENGERGILALVEGAVQGVGFRPYVYRLAQKLGIRGAVSNTPEGALIEAEGATGCLESFLSVIEQDPPALAEIRQLRVEWRPPRGMRGFIIKPSNGTGEKRAQILPDIATCDDCLQELFNPSDRRYRYPFINCTHCGPRYSILEQLPYDRPNTSMKGFALCDACGAEYKNPLDRRFHAQPVACPDCGPQLALWDAAGRTVAERDAALEIAVAEIRSGRVLAIKGLGGFQLLVDAMNHDAVAELRRRKGREEKPFALLFPNLEAVLSVCEVSAVEQKLLRSAEAPIVLLRQRGEHAARLGLRVAPGMCELGVMLPYTPLHHLIMDSLQLPIVATSGNRSDEPICIDEHEALVRLKGIADRYLVHNRPVVRHIDDSVARVVHGREMILRRARGFAPQPAAAARGYRGGVLAFGAHLKNAVAVGKGGQVTLSQHIGDLETTQAVDAFARAAKDLHTLYDTRATVVACDLHPDYRSSLAARESGLPCCRVQHHYAHVLACMLEHGLEGPVLGVAWDGTGYGPDGTIWGGEFLNAAVEGFERIAAFRTFALPGGESAVREPRRAALGIIHVLRTMRATRLKLQTEFTPVQLHALEQMIVIGLNSPHTSSVGRLFDAAASLCGIKQRSGFEGQAAMLFEAAAAGLRLQDPRYAIVLRAATEPAVGSPEYRPRFELDWEPLFQALVEDIEAHRPVMEMSACFHEALAGSIITVAQASDHEHVVLSGGCFQNKLLIELAIDKLQAAGYHVYWPRRIPPNDGGIAAGQALHALAALEGLPMVCKKEGF